MAENPPVETVTRRGITGLRRRAQVAHPQCMLRGVDGGVQHRALQRFTRKLTVGAGQTQGQGFVFQQAVDIECVAPKDQPGIMQTGRAAFYPRMVITFRRIVTQHPAPVAKTGKGHICLTAGVSRRNNIIDGVNFRMPVLNTHGAQQVFIFQRRKMQWIGFQREQVDHRYAVQADIFGAERQIVRPAFREHHVNFESTHSCRPDHILQPVEGDKHKLLAEGEILQQ